MRGSNGCGGFARNQTDGLLRGNPLHPSHPRIYSLLMQKCPDIRSESLIYMHAQRHRTLTVTKLRLALPPILVMVCLLSWLFGPALAQSPDNTLSGVMVDQNYAAISGVRVTLLDKARARARQIVTEADGTFHFALLPPGLYVLRANCQGFSPVEIEINLELALPENDKHRAIRIQMQVAEIGATVNVSAKRSAPEPLLPEPLITREFIERLPLNGLTLQPLITLLPGVVLTRATQDEQGQFSANGQRANANYFTVDGVSGNTGVTASFGLGQAGAGALPGLSATGGTNSLVSSEALQEFKLQTGAFTAETGRTPGAAISLVTRAGSREFHGSLFEYFRHDALAANDWFANRAGFNKAALRQHNFGGVLGGPLLGTRHAGRERTQFFASYEGLRLLQPLFGISAVPSLRARREAPSAIKPLVKAYPLPNGEDLGSGLARFSAGYSDPTKLEGASVRLDHVFSARQTLFARFNFAPSHLSQRTNNLSRVLDTEFAQQSLTVGATQSFGARGGNDLRINYARAAGRSFNRLDNFGGAQPPAATALFPAFATPQNAVTTIYLDGAPPLSLGKYVDNTQQQLNVADNLTLLVAEHQLKFGIDYRRLLPRNRPAAYDAAFNFVGVAGAEDFPAPTGTLLSGTALSAQIAARDEIGLRFQNLSAYGQDTWRITPRLQLTFGLRWEFNPPPTATAGRELYTVSGLTDLSTLTLRAGQLWQRGFGELAPRIGVAWQLMGGKHRVTTLRGGWGIFYDLGAGVSASNAASYPYFRNKSVFALTGVPFPLNRTQAQPPPLDLEALSGSFEVFDPKLQQPRTYHWGVTFEQRFDANHLLSVSYVGAAGRALLRRAAWRNLTPDFAGPLYVTDNTATSDYNALQMQFQRRLTRGLQILASYTWAHALDLASNDSAPLTPANRLAPRLDRGNADFDVRHQMASALTFDLPILPQPMALFRNWSVATLFRAQTATPINITYQRDIGFGFFPLRPDLVPGVPVFISDPTAPGGKRFNTATTAFLSQPAIQVGPFKLPREPRQGTLGRNTLRGFPFWQLDVAVQRQFTLTGKFKLQLRADVFNLLNHPNFSSASGALTDPFFGTATSMLNRGLGTAGVNGGLNPVFQVGGPRAGQVVLKLTF